MLPLKILVSHKEQEAVASIVDKYPKLKNFYGDKNVLIDFDALYKFLTKEEIAIVGKYLSVVPRDYGFFGPYFGKRRSPSNLVAIRDQEISVGGKIFNIPTQFLPKNVHRCYVQMKEAMYGDISKVLYIDSGFRSDAYQMLSFLHHFRLNKFDLKKTIALVALPGYSEHNFPKRQACDFVTAKGVPAYKKNSDFAKSFEYKWMVLNAKKFNFFLSYPKNNDHGVIFEPWHWHFEKK